MSSFEILKRIEQIRAAQRNSGDKTQKSNNIFDLGDGLANEPSLLEMLSSNSLTEEKKLQLQIEFETALPNADFNLCNSEVYYKLLAYAKIIHYYEKNGIAEEHAYKLAVLYSDEKNAITYLKNFIKKNPSSQQPMHDACSFALPRGEFDLVVWRKLCEKFMNEEVFRQQVLPQAVALEALIKSKEKDDKSKKPKPKVISDATAKYEKVNSAVKNFRRHHRKLTPEQESEFKLKLSELTEARSELTSLGMPFNHELTLTALNAFKDIYISESSLSFDIFLQNGLTKADYERFTKLERKDDDEIIPNVKIAGHGAAAGYYLMKVPVMDEAHAARAACFGKLTGCCQSLSGEAGESCVIHGLTSENGGFYVVCQGDVNRPQITDKVIGQCWAWRSRSGAIVFDSVEATRKDPNAKKIVITFFEELAKQIVKKHNIEKVACGAFAGVSSEVGIKSLLNTREEFIDYAGYNDSATQRVLQDIMKPFYFYEKDPECKSQTDAMILESVSQTNVPLIDSPFMSSLMNWALIDDDSAIYKVFEILKNHERSDEFFDIYRIMSRYVKNGLSEHEMIVKMKENQFSSSWVNREGQSALIAAATTGKIDFMRCALEKAANIDEKDSFGNTLLLNAVKNGQSSIGLFLLEKGANADEMDTNGEMILLHASKSGAIDIVLKLLEKGVELDKKNPKGETALIIAARNGHAELALKLIEHGAKLDEQNGFGLTALMEAAAKGDKTLVRKLIENGAEVDKVDAFGETALMKAVKEGHTGVVLLLIEKGANVNIRNSHGSSPLMLAIRNDHNDLTLKFIEKVGFVDAKDEHGNTALMTAGYKGNLELVLKLIELGANVNEQNRFGKTALMQATERGFTEVVHELIEKGADIAYKDVQNHTALMKAVLENRTSLALKLIDWGAKIDVDQIGFFIKRLERNSMYENSLEFKKLHEIIKDKISEINKKAINRVSPVILSNTNKPEVASSSNNIQALDPESKNKEHRSKDAFKR